MAQKSKKFRVATEGATTDGRRIERSWIEQMAKNFDPNKYGARVWLEHYRGTVPESSFRAYGDVLSVESRPVEDGTLLLNPGLADHGPILPAGLQVELAPPASAATRRTVQLWD
ncbi:GPO family capsid scaffolding protein [Variovorax sp. PAMC26660]|uniref:GPO family capsid scaffolding protein n=1 Tax=Variovorax sp. PAMC26660 TaxID=2762322 RepID=UPI00164E1D13|nr:GPO family capsid scaffolding protein [Variovorax sp. PAMC26660]